MVYPDDQLIDDVKENDYASYNHIFMLYYNRLCLFVASITNNTNDSEDIVQELFIKLWTDRRKINIQNTISGYLFQAAKNMALNHIRDTTNRKVAIEKLQQADFYIENELETEEFRIALENCIDQLPARCKEVLLMYRVQELKQKEIAEKLNISIKTIKNQIWASLQRLRKCLEVNGF